MGFCSAMAVFDAVFNRRSSLQRRNLTEDKFNEHIKKKQKKLEAIFKKLDKQFEKKPPKYPIVLGCIDSSGNFEVINQTDTDRLYSLAGDRVKANIRERLEYIKLLIEKDYFENTTKKTV